MDRLLRVVTLLALAVSVAAVLGLVLAVLWLGVPALSWGFLTGVPGADLDSGGILPAVAGTAAVTLLMTLAGVPVGVTTAVYLAEYAPKGSLLARVVRTAVRNLAAVPSVVFGLFGLGFFVLFVGAAVDRALWVTSPLYAQPGLLWSSLTLAALTLPVVIVTTEAALSRVPRELREAAFALGASKLQVTLLVVLPHARGGILTGALLATSRGASEVAPILFTGVASYLPRLPTDLRSGFMHLGYHIYVLATQAPDLDRARGPLFGTVLVLLLITGSLNAFALLLRARPTGAE